jgi:hypothetical protein
MAAITAEVMAQARCLVAETTAVVVMMVAMVVIPSVTLTARVTTINTTITEIS